jgi:hypothetical protein
LGVIAVPDGIGTPVASRSQRLTLNSDGRRHPLLNAATVFVFLAGIVAFALGLIVRYHFLASLIGMVAFGVGLFCQLMSATREERIFIMAGVVPAFVGMGLGIAHGGFG